MFLLQKINPRHWARQWLNNQDLPEWLVGSITLAVDVFVLVLVIIITDWLARKVLLAFVRVWVKKSKNKWDDYFYQQRVFINLAHLIPAIIAFNTLPYIFKHVPEVIGLLQGAIKLYSVVILVIVINKSLRAIENLMMANDRTANSPLRTVSQVVRVLSYFVALVFIIAILSGVKASNIIGIMAGTSAILILIFQDTITGLLANFQITMYDLLRIGDWVTLDKYGVDGDVMSIDLTTVKVRNFDKTISSVPAKAFVNDSFVNWRGMQEEGARRIKRNIIIDISSIRYCSHEDVAHFAKVQLIQNYVQQKQLEIDGYNHANQVDTSLRINGRRQTNLGVYRHYILNYLQKNQRVNHNFPIMVRQLQATPQGVPIEAYCFAATTVWEEYERVQADIFDHLYAATEFFGLRLYQAPSGRDVRFMGDQLGANPLDANL